MSKYLSTLLGAQEPHFSQLIKNMENAAAGIGVDVRLAAEVRVALAGKIEELGLDPKDTTAEELYHSVCARAVEDNRFLMETLKIGPNSDSATIITKLARYFSKSPMVPELWALKRTTLKKLLSNHVPHKTMKALHYRSVTSLLKRESPASIYAAAILIEGARYKTSLMGSIKKLGPSDFEISRVEVVQFTPERWESIRKYLKTRTVPVFGVPEANAIVIIPADTEHTHTLALLVAALILHELRRLKEHASYLKFRSLDTKLHEHVRAIAGQGRVHMLTVQGQPVYWHHIHRVFSRQPQERSYLEPHVNPDDLEWTALEASLVNIDERLSFWLGSHLVGLAAEPHPVSLHLIDVCLNVLYKRSLATSGRRFLQDLLWDELLVRYLEVPPFDAALERHMYKITDNEEEILYD